MRAKTSRTLRSALAGTVVLATVLASAACASSPGQASGKGAVKVGLLLNLTGKAAPSFGVPFQRGFQLALDDAKATLQGAGVTVGVATEDAKSAVPDAVTGYNKLRSDGAVLVLNDSQSELAQAVAPLANDDKITFFSGAGATLENKSGYAFRFTDIKTPTLAIGTYLKNHGAKRVGAVVASDNPAFAGVAALTESGVSGGYAVKQAIASTDSDFSALLANLRKANLDGLVLAVLPAQAGNILVQMKQTGGFRGVTAVGTLAASTETYKVAQSAANGFVFPQAWAPGANGSAAFETAYKAKYQETPTAYGALGYQVGWIAVATAISAHRKATVTGTAMRDALSAASTDPLVKQHGILDLTVGMDGKPTSSGVLATFDTQGHVVTLKSAS
jgi:ABC-type branched-subunit amino acid transport system substrate-binding protein